jgi:excinuclease UvrABC nuclease subunit
MILSIFIDFLEGKSLALIGYIHKEIQHAIDAQNFEWAGKLRDMLYSLKAWEQKQDIHLSTNFS